MPIRFRLEPTMRRRLMSPRRVLLVAGLGVVAFAAVTLLALEGVEVVQLRTTMPDGGTRTTRAWVADADGAQWIEAATPERPFLRDLAMRPDVELVRGGRATALRATIVAGDEGHRKIRALLRARYGWADRWIGLLADTSRSVAVRLDAGEAGGPAAATGVGAISFTGRLIPR